MAKLEQLTKDALVSGIVTNKTVTVINAEWHGSDVVEVTYRLEDGNLGSSLLYRDQEASIEIAEAGPPWSFTGNSTRFRLVSAAAIFFGTPF
ncbi:MAG: hypothetical protein R3C03_22065 [Pirellulaceae bacterium]